MFFSLSLPVFFCSLSPHVSSLTFCSLCLQKVTTFTTLSAAHLCSISWSLPVYLVRNVVVLRQTWLRSQQLPLC